MELKMKLERIATEAGSLGVFDVDNENKVRVVIEQAGPSNTVVVSAKLRGQTDFVVLKTLTGNSNNTVNVSTYEVMKIECTVFDAVSESIRVLASSFNEASGSTEVDAPTGGIITDIEVLHFTSSDGSVSIVGSNVTKSLDFTVDFTDFDDVLEFPTLSAFPTVGLTNTIYVAKDTESLYRWSGSIYIEVSPSPVQSVAGRVGDVILDSSDVGLSNVDNTSDALKPISNATQLALDEKVDVSGDTMTGPLNMQGGADNIEFSVYGLTSTSTIEIKSDNQVTIPSGDVKLTTGDAFGSDYAGSIYLQGGSNVDGNPANIQLTAGQSGGLGANGSIILDSKNVVYLNQNSMGSIQASNHRIEDVLDPIGNQDAATKIWVESLSSITNTIIVDASSTTPYPDGSIFKPFPTITEAITVATNNTVLIVLPGLYEETKILIPSTLKNLVILGQSRDNTIIKNGVEYIAPADDITVLFEKIDIGQFTLDVTYALNGIVNIKQSSVIFDRIDNNFNVVMSVTESNIVGGSIGGGPTNINECLILSSPTIFRGLLIIENTKFIQDIAVSGPELVTIRTLDCELFGAPRFISGNSNTIWETDLATDYLGAASSVTKVLLARVPLSSIAQSSAITGDVPTWNGTTWIPVAPSGGGGGGVTDHTLLTSIGVYPHADIDIHISSISNPHSVTASQVGLSNVNNTSDINKPISTLTQSALDLITDVNWTGDYNNGVTYTVGDGVMFNGASFRMISFIGAAGYPPPSYPGSWLQVTDYVSPNDIGLGNVDNTSDINKPISSATQDALDLKYDASNPNGYITLAEAPAGAVSSVNGQIGDVFLFKEDIGLANVDNTTDLNKPISIATQDALDLKFDQPVGLVTEYVAGDGSIQPFPTVPTSSNLITEVYNKSGSLIPKFHAVYINGGQGNLPSIVLSQANTEPSSSKTYGVVRSNISNMSSGFVIAQGRLENLDTAALGGTEGTSLWLSPSVAGDITITKPSAPNHAVYIGTIVRSHPTQGVVEIKIQNGFELQEIHNVSINGSLVDNQVLKYDAPNLLWKNETLVKADVGLDQVDNTSDINKPVSTATATAISDKVSKAGDTMTGALIIAPSSGTNAATIQNVSIGQPFGAGLSVISTKLSSTDQLYLQTTDQTGAVASRQVILTSGWAASAASGGVQILSGNSTVTGATGSVNVSSGIPTSGVSGAAFLRSGNSAAGATGISRVITGNSGASSSGIIEIFTGTSAATSNTGYVNILSGSHPVGATAESGGMFLHSGNNLGSGATGVVSLYSGNATSGNSGILNMNTGSSSSGSSGALNILTGNSSSGLTGGIVLKTGTASASPNSRGPVILEAQYIQMGTATNQYALYVNETGVYGKKELKVQNDLGNSIHLDMNTPSYPSLYVGTSNTSGMSSKIGAYASIDSSGGEVRFTGSIVKASVDGTYTSGTTVLKSESSYITESSAANVAVSSGQVLIQTNNAYVAGSLTSANTGNIRLTTGTPAGSGSRGSVIIEAPELNLDNNRIIKTSEFYFGDPTVDGTWRIRPSGGNLISEVRQSGVWVTKQTIIA